jgi:hypothetical protein
MRSDRWPSLKLAVPTRLQRGGTGPQTVSAEDARPGAHGRFAANERYLSEEIGWCTLGIAAPGTEEKRFRSR